MTFEDETEVQRTSVGAKVLVFACAILAVLGSFWTIVWFIRSYVEAPRVASPAPMALARESAPVVPPTATVAPAPIGTKATVSAQPAPAPQIAAPQVVVPPPAPAQATSQPAQTSARRSQPAEAANGKTVREDPPAAAGALAERWVSVPPAAPAPAPAPRTAPQVETAPAALAVTPPDNDSAADEVEESSVPAIPGTAPLPRRKPSHRQRREAERRAAAPAATPRRPGAAERLDRRCLRPTTASRNSSGHSIAAPASIRCGR